MFKEQIIEERYENNWSYQVPYRNRTYLYGSSRIEKECERLGYEVKVETQGSQGTENKLTKREIAKADYVIIAADVVIEEPERFYGKWVLKTRIKPLLKNTQGVLSG